MEQVTADSFEAEVLHSPIPVLVDFYTDRCTPCRLLAPILQEVAGERSGQLKVVKVDAASEPQLAANYRISSVPSLFLFRAGAPITQLIGNRDKQELDRWIDAALE